MIPRSRCLSPMGCRQMMESSPAVTTLPNAPYTYHYFHGIRMKRRLWTRSMSTHRRSIRKNVTVSRFLGVYVAGQCSSIYQLHYTDFQMGWFCLTHAKKGNVNWVDQEIKRNRIFDVMASTTKLNDSFEHVSHFWRAFIRSDVLDSLVMSRKQLQESITY